LNCLHKNPVKRGLVSSPGERPWSSGRHSFFQDTSVLRMGRLD
jgi:hypothetical protein